MACVCGHTPGSHADGRAQTGSWCAHCFCDGYRESTAGFNGGSTGSNGTWHIVSNGGPTSGGIFNLSSSSAPVVTDNVIDSRDRAYPKQFFKCHSCDKQLTVEPSDSEQAKNFFSLQCRDYQSDSADCVKFLCPACSATVLRDLPPHIYDDLTHDLNNDVRDLKDSITRLEFSLTQFQMMRGLLEKIDALRPVDLKTRRVDN